MREKTGHHNLDLAPNKRGPGTLLQRLHCYFLDGQEPSPQCMLLKGNPATVKVRSNPPWMTFRIGERNLRPKGPTC